MRERKQPLPDPKLLREWLDYDPETGELRWKKRLEESFSANTRIDRPIADPQARHAAWWNGRFAGQLAFTNQNTGGYSHGKIAGQMLTAHRVIWAWMTGKWPASDLDHVNGIRTDNRWANIRPVDKAQQAWNRKIRADSSQTLPRGVKLNANGQVTGKLYRAAVHVRGKSIYLGSFETPEEAHEAYLKGAAAHHGDHSFHLSRAKR